MSRRGRDRAPRPVSASRGARPTLVAVVLGALLAAGCGYRSGLELEGDYRSVGIEMFGNDGPLPGIERELHAELVRSARNMLSVPVRGSELSDVVVRGRIYTYGTRGGLRTGGNRLRSLGIRLVAEGELWSASGRLLRGPVRANVNVGYLNEGRLGQDEEARARAMKNVSDALLLKLLVPHADPEAPPAENPALIPARAPAVTSPHSPAEPPA